MEYIEYYTRLILGLSFAILSILSLYRINKRRESYKASKLKQLTIVYILMFLTGIGWITTAFYY